MSLIVICVYALPLLGIATIYWYRHQQAETTSAGYLQAAVESGLTEPASLHPVIDPASCIGCGSCVSACPEGKVLGLIDKRAVLVNPADCIGHGACQRACPQDAIRLVLGTKNRGIEIPELSPQFETNVPGIFVAGELGGMGLVKNAIEQGKQAMRGIADQLKARAHDAHFDWDTIIVGCGPAGISAALQARESGLNALTIDRGIIGGTVAHFPRMKMVMTSPAELPGIGKVKFSEIRKEDLLSFWQDVVRQQQPEVHEGEKLLSLTPIESHGFVVNTDKADYRARTVLLAMGRRGNPRQLEVPGEELSKVVYELDDPAQYAGLRVLIVGGGDSAIEAAIACAEVSPGQVTLCYRGEGFNRAKRKNRDALEAFGDSGRLAVYLDTNVVNITSDTVTLSHAGEEQTLANDQVIICIGGEPPTNFLKQLGISVVTKYGET